MTKNIYFSVEYCDSIPMGQNIVSVDGSLLFDPSIDIDAFSLYPYHWSFELTTKNIDPNKYLIRYAMGGLCLNGSINAQINIPQSIKGKVYMHFSFFPNADGVYYNDFFDFIEKKYFDNHNSILAVGNIEANNGICIEFAEGQYALINEKNMLEALYVHIDKRLYNPH